MLTDNVPDLIAIGMTEREAKLYVAMLEKPEWRAGELHRVTGIQRAETHRTLELMVSKEYCTKRVEGRFNYYKPMDPDSLKEILLYRYEKEMSGRVHRTESTLKNLSAVFRAADNKLLDIIEIVKTPPLIQKRFRDLVLSTKKEIISFDRSPYSFMSNNKPTRKQKEQTDANISITERGIKYRTTVMYEKKYWPFLEEQYEKYEDKKLGHTRVTEYLPIKMFVFDAETALLGVTGVSGTYGETFNQIIIHDASIARACCDLFEMYWEKAIPYQDWKVEYNK